MTWASASSPGGRWWRSPGTRLSRTGPSKDPRPSSQATEVADGLVRVLGAQHARGLQRPHVSRGAGAYGGAPEVRVLRPAEPGVIRRTGDLGAPSFDRDRGARPHWRATELRPGPVPGGRRCVF